jgi:replicative DNA helicase
MKRLLRSVIDVDGAITQENLVFNFTKLLNSRIEWGRQDDDKLFKFVYQYFQTQLEVPALQTVRDYFERLDDIETLERLKAIEVAQPYIRTNFNNLLTQILDDQSKLKAVQLLKEANEIITRGMEIEGERKFGIRDGLMHFTQRANDLIVPNFNARFRGDVRMDAEEMKKEYITAKNSKDKVWGRMCGIAEIDRTCKGAKRGELWVHAAYPGELKSTFAVNWCYNLITHFKTNVLYVSLEMPYEQIRRNIYTVHTANAKWAQMGYAPLDYRKIRDGELTPEEEAFYFNHVIPDFNTNPGYCHFEVINPDKEMTMADIRMEAELLHKQMELGFVVIDHGQWVEAAKGKKSKDYVIELNSIVRDAKRFAMQFNHNEGIPVCLLWQINREGKDDADKNDGLYKAKALTYANEVEKTADYITTTYLNQDHRRNGTTRFGCLKNRDNPPFQPFDAMVDFTSRRMYSMNRTTLERPGMANDDDAQQIMARSLGDV